MFPLGACRLILHLFSNSTVGPTIYPIFAHSEVHSGTRFVSTQTPNLTLVPLSLSSLAAPPSHEIYAKEHIGPQGGHNTPRLIIRALFFFTGNNCMFFDYLRSCHFLHYRSICYYPHIPLLLNCFRGFLKLLHICAIFILTAVLRSRPLCTPSNRFKDFVAGPQPVFASL